MPFYAIHFFLKNAMLLFDDFLPKRASPSSHFKANKNTSLKANENTGPSRNIKIPLAPVFSESNHIKANRIKI